MNDPQKKRCAAAVKWLTAAALAALMLLLALGYGIWSGALYHASRVRLRQPEPGVRVPVLMYHAIGDDCWGEEGLFVKPAELEKQLQYLSENGYDTIFFEDLSNLDQYDKPIILTFDDGYDDNYSILLPLLKKYNMKATVFVIAETIGAPHKLTQAQLREMAQSGLVSLQSHGWSHREMETMTWTELIQELFRSRNTIAAASGKVPYVLSYPNGRYSERTRTAARLFYAYAVRTYEEIYVTGNDPMQIERIAVKRGTSMEQFIQACRQSGR